jgi:hypothetical protein
VRARDFITEVRGLRSKLHKGKQPYTHGVASTGNIHSRGYYDLYRASLAVAGMDKDGNIENIPDAETWLGSDGYVAPYTDEEYAMTKKAYKALDMKIRDGEPKGSREPDAVNTASPIKGFKGYPR